MAAASPSTDSEEEMTMTDYLESREGALKYAWQICDEEQCSDEVFQLAVSIFDRVRVLPDACNYRPSMLISSALGLATHQRRMKPITPSALKEYLNCIFTTEEIIDCHNWITDTLNDQIEATLPSDYNRVLVNKLVSIGDRKNDVVNCANKFINLALPARQFSEWTAERIGMAGVAAAIRRLPNAEYVWPLEKKRIQRISGLCKEILEQDMEKFEDFITISISDAKLISSACLCISGEDPTSSFLTDFQLNSGPVFPTYS